MEKAPFVCDGTASELAAVLAPGADSEDPIRRPLPNSEASIYDALIDCL